jgi:hypothetical protein
MPAAAAGLSRYNDGGESKAKMRKLASDVFAANLVRSTFLAPNVNICWCGREKVQFDCSKTLVIALNQRATLGCVYFITFYFEE